MCTPQALLLTEEHIVDAWHVIRAPVLWAGIVDISAKYTDGVLQIGASPDGEMDEFAMRGQNALSQCSVENIRTV